MWFGASLIAVKTSLYFSCLVLCALTVFRAVDWRKNKQNSELRNEEVMWGITRDTHLKKIVIIFVAKIIFTVCSRSHGKI
jgi:hypothetical protein